MGNFLEDTLTFLVIGGTLCGLFYWIDKHDTEVAYRTQHRFVEPRLPINTTSKGETFTEYNGKNYFIKFETNGIPYFEPIKGEEE